MSRKLAVELVNTETEEIEAYDEMSEGEIRQRNYTLIAKGEPQRWIPIPDDEEDQ